MSMKRVEREELDSALIRRLGDEGEAFSATGFAEEHGISVQSVYKHLRGLAEAGKIRKEKSGRKNVYALVDRQADFTFPLAGLAEDRVWSRDIAPLLTDMPPLAKANCSYAFTEMLNNAIDHSDGTEAWIRVRNNGYRVNILIADNGVGVFAKIADAMHLEEKRYAILELAKGKFTTEPGSHTGEGIFFSSKAVDSFAIFSDQLCFLGPSSKHAPFLDKSDYAEKGTLVLFDILFSHRESVSAVFDRYTQAPDDYGFTKTIVPVRLLEYGDETPLVVSRSQAKRLMTRFERFERIVLDFTGIEEIGQGFADELFRVFPQQHPGTVLQETCCNARVQRMIDRVRAEK